MGLLKWVVGAYEKDGEFGVFDSRSSTSSLSVDFAIRQVKKEMFSYYVKKRSTSKLLSIPFSRTKILCRL